PLTVEEFPQAARHFPIIFSTGESPVPLALMGLNEGVNTFVDGEGNVDPGIYLPAYARRYPFMLAKLQPESEELSLCFDPSADLIGPFDEGEPLF
ncbi:SapC family protein, partial [Klebsiella grimontii]